MLKLKVQVPVKRDRAGFVEIVDGFRTVGEGIAVATSGFAGKGKDRGHPPLGRYELTAREATPGGADAEYGPQILLFEPAAGPALEAESLGRFGVLLYAGSVGSDSLLRRTQGGVRLSRRAMETLLRHVRDDTEVELEIEALTPPPWWAFWRKRRTPPALSRDPPRLTAPPYDEATLAARMLRSAIRRSRAPQRRTADDRDRWQDRDTSAGSSRDSGSEFTGRGGAGGGAGASGGWSDAPAAGRGPGVSAAGIIAGAAGAAAIAAAAASGSDSTSRASSDAEAGGSFGDAGSAGSDSGSAITTTSTAY